MSYMSVHIIQNSFPGRFKTKLFTSPNASNIYIYKAPNKKKNSDHETSRPSDLFCLKLIMVRSVEPSSFLVSERVSTGFFQSFSAFRSDITRGADTRLATGQVKRS